MDRRKYMTTGEVANAMHVTKNTLFHYDKIGLFSPEIKLDNDYRFYSTRQLEVLEAILWLRELDMPLDPAAPPVPVRLELELVDPQPGEERARQLLDQAQTALREAGIRVDYYCLTLYTKDFAPFADVGRQYQLEDVPAGQS